MSPPPTTCGEGRMTCAASSSSLGSKHGWSPEEESAEKTWNMEPSLTCEAWARRPGIGFTCYCVVHMCALLADWLPPRLACFVLWNESTSRFLLFFTLYEGQYWWKSRESTDSSRFLYDILGLLHDAFLCQSCQLSNSCQLFLYRKLGKQL